MAESSPLSYQTTMPEYPDTSYEAYQKTLTGSGVFADRWRPGSDRGSTALFAWLNGHPNYENWRANEIDTFNAKLSAYNTWLQSGAGIRASAESGGYNPSYFKEGASASPINYQNAPEGNGLSEMAQGISGVFQFAQALQQLSLTSAQIRGVNLENQKKAIENQYAATISQYKRDKLGYQADWLNMVNSAELARRYRLDQSLWRHQPFSPFGTMTYNLDRANLGFIYDRNYSDIAFLKAGTKVRAQQEEMLRWDAKSKQFYNQSMQSLEKVILENQGKILQGTFNFQPIEQKLRKQAVQWGIGVNVANAAINTAKLFIPGKGIISAASSPGSPSWGNMPFQSHTLNDGFDVLNGDYYPWYR